MQRFKSVFGPLIAMLLAACSGSGSLAGKVTPSSISGLQALRGTSLTPCSNVVTSNHESHTVARLGGGDNIVVESSAYTNCDIGIYVGGTHGPKNLDHTVVSGVFKIGVYIDSTGSMHLDHTSICVNGANNNGTCKAGSNSSTGTALDVQNTPHISIDHTNIDGYAAGFATTPCPNTVRKGPNANDINVDHTTITNSTYPWSFMGGDIDVNHSSPAPPIGGSCSPSGLGGSISITTTVAPLPHSLGPLLAVSRLGSGTLSGSSATFQVDPISTNLVGVYDSGRRFGWMAISPAWFVSGPDHSLGPDSTAVALTFLIPGIFSADPQTGQQEVSILRTLPSVLDFAAALKANELVADPLSVPAVINAYKRAFSDGLKRFQAVDKRTQSSELQPSGVLSNIRRLQQTQSVSTGPLHTTSLIFFLNPTDSNVEVQWAQNLPFGQGLWWTGAVYQVDTSGYPSEIFFTGGDPWNVNVPLTQAAPIARFYVSPNQDIWALFSLSTWIDSVIGDLGFAPSSNADAFPVPSSQNGSAYIIHAYTCGLGLSNISNEVKDQSIFISWPGAEDNWLNSCELNGAMLGISVLNTIIDVSSTASDLHGVKVAVESAIESSVSTWDNLTPNLSSQEFQSTFAKDAVTTATNIVLAIAADESPAINMYQEALGIYSITADFGNLGNTLGSAFGVEPWQDSYLIVGNPWAVTGNGSATELAFLLAPTSLTAGVASTPFTVVTAASNGVGAPVATATTIFLSSSAPGTFNQNSITIPAGTFGNLFPGLPNGPDSITFAPQEPGPVTITATAQGLGSQSITISASPPATGNGSATELAFLQPPTSLTAGTASTPFTVVTARSNGVGAPVATATTISLSSSAPGTFSQNSIAIPAGTFGNLFPGLPNGPDSITFTPSQSGPVRLTATAPNLQSASVILNVSP